MPFRDPEERRRYAREWIRRNADRARDAMRRWRKAHPDEHSAEVRSYYARHREERLAQSAEYHRANPHIGVARSQNYRARRLTAPGAFTAAEWLALIAQYGGRCAYCGQVAALQADHRTPLSRGGTNAIGNILPACGRCNASKHTLTEEEFRARRGSEGPDDLESTEEAG